MAERKLTTIWCFNLSTFGKALGNGFSLSALAGRREIMRLGGLDRDQLRVFPTVHWRMVPGTHALATGLAVLNTYQREPVVQVLWEQGRKLAVGINRVIADQKLEGHFTITGQSCCLTYGTRDADKQPSQAFRTLFLQEMIRHGILAPSFVVSYSHSDADVGKTVEAVHAALVIYRKALTDGVEKYLQGRPVKPVARRYN